MLVPSSGWARTGGFLYPYLTFTSFVTDEFTELFQIWYPEGTKIVPRLRRPLPTK